MAKTYIGILDGVTGAFGVRIPDFPGCHGAGNSHGEAIADATRALREFATDMIASGEKLPEPSEIFAVMEAAIDEEGPNIVAIGIPLLLDQSRSVRANISLDAGLLEHIDDEAKRRGITRSAFIASAAREKIIAGH